MDYWGRKPDALNRADGQFTPFAVGVSSRLLRHSMPLWHSKALIGKR